MINTLLGLYWWPKKYFQSRSAVGDRQGYIHSGTDTHLKLEKKEACGNKEVENGKVVQKTNGIGTE